MISALTSRRANAVMENAFPTVTGNWFKNSEGKGAKKIREWSKARIPFTHLST